jgi:S1/P1 Nuclease
MRRNLSLLAAVLAASLGTSSPAHAWGCKGHQTVALIAEKHLTPEAHQLVEKLLGENPIDPQLKRYCGNSTPDLMVDAATWPDDIRNERHNGAWHYIDIPRGKHEGSLDEYCGDEGCVIRSIDEQRAILKDQSADPRKRAEAIRYLIHFVGDLHQPLHVTTNGDNGGNCVPVKYLHHEPLPNLLHPDGEAYSPSLHQIWDTEIVERDMEVSSPHRYAEELDGKFRAETARWEAARIHVQDWAWEVHERAEREVYGAFSVGIRVEPDAKPKDCSDNHHIGRRMFEKHLTADEAYQSRAAKAAEKGLAEAGVRLAMILNDAAKPNP